MQPLEFHKECSRGKRCLRGAQGVTLCVLALSGVCFFAWWALLPVFGNIHEAGAVHQPETSKASPSAGKGQKGSSPTQAYQRAMPNHNNLELNQAIASVEAPALQTATGEPPAQLARKSAAVVRLDNLAADYDPVQRKHVQNLEGGLKAILTLDPELQAQADRLLRENKVPWGAVVVLEPSTGKVRVLSGYSHHEKASSQDAGTFALRGGLPAASLIKIITSAAAMEHSGLKGHSAIHFRGGNYTLSKSNYLPNARLDRRVMTLRDALARSCNPAFARIGLNEINEKVLASYARAFGFNRRVPFELPLPVSQFPEVGDEYDLARTAAGFGDVLLSPLHAAMIAQVIANDGVMLRPVLVEEIRAKSGAIISQAEPMTLSRSISPSTAATLREMMTETTRTGTARKQFSRWNRTTYRNVEVAAKTGTLTGSNPEGKYHWLVAVAPAENPQVALATVVVDDGRAKINGSGLGRMMLEKILETSLGPVRVIAPEPKPTKPRKVWRYSKKGRAQKVAKKAKYSASKN